MKRYTQYLRHDPNSCGIGFVAGLERSPDGEVVMYAEAAALEKDVAELKLQLAAKSVQSDCPEIMRQFLAESKIRPQPDGHPVWTMISLVKSLEEQVAELQAENDRLKAAIALLAPRQRPSERVTR